MISDVGLMICLASNLYLALLLRRSIVRSQMLEDALERMVTRMRDGRGSGINRPPR